MLVERSPLREISLGIRLYPPAHQERLYRILESPQSPLAVIIVDRVHLFRHNRHKPGDGHSAEPAGLFQLYRPEYSVSGHSHQFPYFVGSSWLQRIDGVNVLVPGQLLSAPFPNHIVLNTESGQASWETFSQEWISEDAIYLRTVSSITDSDLIRPA
jgi:hypothetical protein